MKYIVLEVTRKGATGDTVWELPFIFPEMVVHKDIADRLIHMFGMCYDRSARVVSAGFCSSTGVGMELETYGESESLGVKSRPEKDVQLIRSLDYTHGLVF